MKLNTEILSRFTRGQLEIRNEGEEYFYRGEIETATVEGVDVVVRLRWLAKRERDGWVNNPTLLYSASTVIYSASDIGEGRIALESPIVGEIVVFFPPNASTLDPSCVKGLKLTT